MRERKTVQAGEITQKEYGWLLKQPYMTTDQEKVMKNFEKENPAEVIDEKPVLITKPLVWRYFKLAYKIETGEEFKETDDSLANIGVIINYFVKNPDFFKSSNLVNQVGRSRLKPSFSKGLLVIGTYGNGKTTIMRALSRLFNHFELPMRYKSVNAHDVVTEYETLETPGDKFLFYERYKCKGLYIDDVKKEATASNYGKKEILRAILEKRYDNGLKTYITCNFREGDASEDVPDAMSEFGERYGEHIYDRLFKMFNIIQFKGGSFRN
ncbi:hypothetical protein [Christiangramia sp.]|uniref:hypothetical protein n=1 Tax=Christiangramia sp. TaxID=1931228 RepID=UPI0026344720|nr:hypothetical protein [Christiangramia sp.]